MSYHVRVQTTVVKTYEKVYVVEASSKEEAEDFAMTNAQSDLAYGNAEPQNAEEDVQILCTTDRDGMIKEEFKRAARARSVKKIGQVEFAGLSRRVLAERSDLGPYDDNIELERLISEAYTEYEMCG